MLGSKDYTQEELDHATRAVKQQLAEYQKLLKALNGAGDDPQVTAALEAFEPLLFNNMTLVSIAASCIGCARPSARTATPSTSWSCWPTRG